MIHLSIKKTYSVEKNTIPLNEINTSAASLSDKPQKFALLSLLPVFNHIDAGKDDLLNCMLWFSPKGNAPYLKQITFLSKKVQKDDDDWK